MSHSAQPCRIYRVYMGNIIFGIYTCGCRGGFTCANSFFTFIHVVFSADLHVQTPFSLLHMYLGAQFYMCKLLFYIYTCSFQCGFTCANSFFAFTHVVVTEDLHVQTPFLHLYMYLGAQFYMCKLLFRFYTCFFKRFRTCANFFF